MKKLLFLFFACALAFSCKHDEKNSPSQNNSSNQFVLSFMTDSTLGELIVRVDKKQIKSGTFVSSGKTASFEAKAKDGYCVDYWKINEKDEYKGQEKIDIKIENHTNVFLYFKVKPKVCKLTYSFNENEGSVVAQKEDEGNTMPVESGASINEGTKIIFEATPKDDFSIAGWSLNGKPVNDLNSRYEFEITEDSLVKIDFSNLKYEDDDYFVSFRIESPITIPIKFDDSKKATITNSFAIAKYELTYNIWYKTYMWAIENGYTFANAGIAGSKGVEPTDAENGATNKSPIPAHLEVGDERQRQPVTKISWRDAIVWCNAHSEKNGLQACYKHNGQIIKDATLKSDGTHFDTDFIDTEKVTENGYRLPYSDEWEAAARFALTQENAVTESGTALTATINGKLAYFTKGDSASGAKKNHSDVDECKRVAWFDMNSGEGYGDKGQTHVVATKDANDLGLFDMAGNIYELVTEKYTGDPSDPNKRIRRGGAWWFNSEGLRIGSRLSAPVNAKNDFVGFRLVKNIGEVKPAEFKVAKIVIGKTEYLKQALFGGKALSHLESGNEEVLISDDKIDIAIYMEKPKELKVELTIDSGSPEELQGIDGTFEKKNIAITETFKTFSITLSKDGYSEKRYSFKAKKNTAPTIPENLKIKKFFASAAMTKPSKTITATNNGLDYNVEVSADAAEGEVYLWILGEEREAKFRLKGASESSAKEANGNDRYEISPLPKKNETKTFVIVMSYDGEEFEYNLNVTVKGE